MIDLKDRQDGAYPYMHRERSVLNPQNILKAKNTMAKRKADYFGLSRLVSLILAIIPFTSWICGAITRLQEGKIVAGIIRLIFGWNIVYIVDLVLMIVNGQIWRLINM